MDSKISVFKPRYPLPYRLGFFALPVLFFGMLCRGAGAPRLVPHSYWYLALACGVLTSLSPFFLIREIRFVNDIVIRRYFLPDIFVNFKDVFTIEPGFIHVNEQRFRTGPLENIEELQDMAQHWFARQILKAASARDQSPIQLIFPRRGFGPYGGFWGLILGVIVVLLEPTWLHVDPRWLPGIAFLAIYFMFVYVIPKYL